MKKTIIAAILCGFYLQAFALLQRNEIGIELYGGYNFASLQNFNNNLINVFNYGFLDGFASPVPAKAIPGILQADIKIRYSFEQNMPVYLRFGLNRLVDTQILYNTVSGTDIAVSTASFNILYTGIGAKYGFEMSRQFLLFICGDLGFCVPIDSYWSVTGNAAESPPVNSDISDPLYNASQRIDFTGVYFGANIGAGLEWQVSRGWGVIIEGGYKVAKYAAAYRKTGIFTNEDFDFDELDFSGPYAAGGIVLYFGGE